ncbi:MAG: hypothetical protein M0T74_13800 [Desulfitobacterium hafniense]|nr:hypothetical protein [Desulfitobacterium hafniense]
MKERHPGDPRSDLVTDHRHWKELLWNCWQSERDLYYLLHGLRCGGAELILTQRGYRLVPGDWNQTEWDKDIRHRLNPFKDKLVTIFKLTRVGKITNEKLPEGVFTEKQVELWRE